MKIRSWKLELLYWVIMIFNFIGGMILANQEPFSWPVWVIGLGMVIIGVTMGHWYVRLLSKTSIWNSDEIKITKKEYYY